LVDRLAQVLDNVEAGSVVSTDERVTYNLLAGDGFEHGVVKHGAKEYDRRRL
jgi:transposase